MTTPLSRLQHDLSLAPGIPDSYRLFGEGPTVSTYGDLRAVVHQLDVRHLTSAERAWGEEAASAAVSAVPPSQGTEPEGSGLAAADNNHKALVEAARLATAALDELQSRASSFSASGVYFDEPCFADNVQALAQASDAEDALKAALATYEARP